MARDFASVVSEAAFRLRLGTADAAINTAVTGWANDVIQDVHGRHDWFWALDRQIVQPVADITTGTVSISAGAQAVTGSSTAFAAADVGKFIRFQSSNDWYKITAVTDATTLTIEAPYTGTSALSAGTYLIRKIFYSLPSAEKIVGMKQAQTWRDLVCINHKDFDTFLTYADSTGKATLFCVYGQDSSNNIQFNIYPFADAAYNLEVKYKKKAVQDTLAGIPEKWLGVYLDGILARGMEYVALGQPEFARRAIDEKKSDYERGIMRMIGDSEPESDYTAVLMNRDTARAPLGPRLPDGLSIPLDP